MNRVEHWFNYTAPLTRFMGIIKPSVECVCSLVNNFFSNLVEFVEFSDLSGATVGWFKSFSE